MGRYEFDKLAYTFRKVNSTLLGVLGLVLKYLALSLLLAAVYYLIFALLVSTDTEKYLSRENKMYAQIYPEMRDQEKLVSDVIKGLELKDNQIYKDIFYAPAPGFAPVDATDLFAVSDTIPDRDIVEYTGRKADALLSVADSVEADFQAIIDRYTNGGKLPPLSMPLADVSYVQVGASVGEKMNPFYKVPAAHNGVDIIAPQGSPVLAAAGGFVSEVERSHKGEGNCVVMTHPDGYVTRYSHLGDICVFKGQFVPHGKKIAEVGISGTSFAPHLHYEVLKDGAYIDPVQHFFASVGPDDYANMLYMSVNTGQSMD